MVFYISDFLSRFYDLLLLIIGLILALVADRYTSIRFKHKMTNVLIVLIVLLLSDYVDYATEQLDHYVKIRSVVSYLGYILRPFMILLIRNLFIEKETRWKLWWLALFNAFVMASHFFTHVTYWYSENNEFHREVLGYTPFIISFIMLFYLVKDTYIYAKNEREIESLVFVFSIVSVVMAVFMDISSEMVSPSFTNRSTVVSCILYYIYLHLHFVSEHEDALNEENHIKIMMSQIQPHFLYNTLTTITNLCRKDPEEAEDATIMFAQYLRTNLDSLKITKPVPFNAELSHVQLYLELEKKRFGDKLNVEYDIKETNFKVPSLGLQPIVENSVKHGICEKESPGLLKISSEKCEEGYRVIIEDDGVGFDPSHVVHKDNRSHIGMENVEDRLKKMSNAKLEIISSPGNGCKTIITFPEEQ